MVVRGARCLAGWVLCLADTTAQSAQPERRRAWREGSCQFPGERPDLCEEELGAKVRASFLASDRTYGARRVWHDLLAEGVACGLHRIERLMRQQALKAPPAPASTAAGSG